MNSDNKDPVRKWKISFERIDFGDGYLLIRNFLGADRKYYNRAFRSELNSVKPATGGIELYLTTIAIIDDGPLLKWIESVSSGGVLKPSSPPELPAPVPMPPVDPDWVESSNWDRISFAKHHVYCKIRESHVPFPVDGFDEHLNDFKSVFKKAGLKYKVHMRHRKIVGIRMPDDLKDYMRVIGMPGKWGVGGVELFQDRIDDLITRLKGSQGSLSRALDVVCALLKYSKTHYFHWLAKYQDPDSFVRTVLEPTSGHRGISRELSYIFTLTHKGKYFAIWESVERMKATYVFEFRSIGDYRGSIDFLVRWLSDVANYPLRSQLGRWNDPRFGDIHMVKHDNKVKFDAGWDIRMKAIVM